MGAETFTQGARNRDTLVPLLACSRVYPFTLREPLIAKRWSGELAEAGNPIESFLNESCGDVNTVANSEIKGFEILQRLGRGARSTIYKARELKTGNIFAVKHVRLSTTQGDKFLRHVKNEFRMGKRLLHPTGTDVIHPSIVTMYRLRTRSRLFKAVSRDLIMECLNGENLEANPNHPLESLLSCFLQIAKALRYCHSQDIVHGDVKPNNIVLSPDGKATLIDFGFACWKGTRINRIKGTREYISPEQVFGGEIKECTDVYNFGATMYKLLTGRPVPALIPEPGGNAHFIPMDDIQLEPASSLNPNLPKALCALLTWCCSPNQKDRPETMQPVIESLSVAMGELRGREEASRSVDTPAST